MSRGSTAFEIFWIGVSPIETDPGESSTSGRRLRKYYVFEIVNWAQM